MGEPLLADVSSIHSQLGLHLLGATPALLAQARHVDPVGEPRHLKEHCHGPASYALLDLVLPGLALSRAPTARLPLRGTETYVSGAGSKITGATTSRRIALTFQPPVCHTSTL